MIYTVHTDRQGDLFVEQFQADDLEELFKIWGKYSSSKPHIKVVKLQEDFVLITDTKNVWCTSFRDRRRIFFLLHIVQTLEEN